MHTRLYFMGISGTLEGIRKQHSAKRLLHTVLPTHEQQSDLFCHCFLKILIIHKCISAMSIFRSSGRGDDTSAHHLAAESSGRLRCTLLCCQP